MKVILVRHAETEWNKQGIIQGHLDSPVTERGMLETSALLAALTSAAYPVECIYASPLRRAWQMAQNLSGHLQRPLVMEAALKEQAFGRYDGVTWQSLNSNNPDDAKALFAEDAGFCPVGGESLVDASQRIIDFLQQLQLAATHETVCLVSHGQVSQGVLALLKEGKIDNFSRYAHPNASYSVLDMVGGKCIALRWGISTHLIQLNDRSVLRS